MNDPCVGLITTLYALMLLVQFKGLGTKQGGTTKLLIGCLQSGHMCGILKQNRFLVGWQCLRKVIGCDVISFLFFISYFFFQCSLNKIRISISLCENLFRSKIGPIRLYIFKFISVSLEDINFKKSFYLDEKDFSCKLLLKKYLQ